LDLGNERRRLFAAHIDEDARHIAEPASVRVPTVAAHGLSPADHVVAAPAGGTLGLVNDPAVEGENALPAAGAAGQDEQTRLAVGARRRQHADARPVGVAKAPWAVLARVKRGMDCEGQKKQSEDSDEHGAKRMAHGVETDAGCRQKYGALGLTRTRALRHRGALKAGNESAQSRDGAAGRKVRSARKNSISAQAPPSPSRCPTRRGRSPGGRRRQAGAPRARRSRAAAFRRSTSRLRPWFARDPRGQRAPRGLPGGEEQSENSGEHLAR